MRKRPTPEGEGRHPDQHHLTDGATLRLGTDTRPISDQLLIQWPERVAAMEPLAHDDLLRRYPMSTLADIAERPAYCRWASGQALLEGAA